MRKDDDIHVDVPFDIDIPIHTQTGDSELQVTSFQSEDSRLEIPFEETNSIRKEIALKELEESFEILRKMIDFSDKNFTDGISKFTKRLKNNLSKNQIASSLHKFGTDHYMRKLSNKS